MATTPMASPGEDLRLKSLAPAPDRAAVYVYRSESMGGGVTMKVSMDGVESGVTVAQSYLVWEVAPRRHVLMSKAENDFELPIDVQAGKAYYVWQEVKMGVLSARSKLQLVPEAEGRKQMEPCKLVQMPAQARAFNVGKPSATASASTAVLQN